MARYRRRRRPRRSYDLYPGTKPASIRLDRMEDGSLKVVNQDGVREGRIHETDPGFWEAWTPKGKHLPGPFTNSSEAIKALRADAKANTPRDDGGDPLIEVRPLEPGAKAVCHTCHRVTYELMGEHATVQVADMRELVIGTKRSHTTLHLCCPCLNRVRAAIRRDPPAHLPF